MAFGRAPVELDLDLLVSVSSDLGALFVNEKGERRYKRSDDCLGEQHALHGGNGELGLAHAVQTCRGGVMATASCGSIAVHGSFGMSHMQS